MPIVKMPNSLRRLCRVCVAGALFIATSVMARETAPNIVVTIKPLHSLASVVAHGVSEPVLLIDKDVSPHHFQLRPSSARALAKAEVVLWTGPGLERFLLKPLASLAESAAQIAAVRIPGLRLYPSRVDLPIGHAELVRRESLDGQGREHEHEEGQLDYHVWLDPENAIKIVHHLATTLAQLDAPHAERYRHNAATFAQALMRQAGAMRKQLAGLQDRPYVLFHDSFQYFERYFDLPAAAVIAVQPDVRPGATRLKELAGFVRSAQVQCLFSEPQFPSNLTRTIAADNAIRTAVLDPIGAGLTPGAALYAELLQRNAEALIGCLNP